MFDSTAAAAALGYFLILVCWAFAAFLLYVGSKMESPGGLLAGIAVLGLAIYCTAGVWPW